MRPLVKLAVAVIVVVATIFPAAALYLALVFDTNRYKPELAAAVRQATGRELTIDGDLALGLFPQPHVRVGLAPPESRLRKRAGRRAARRSGSENAG